MIEQPPEVFAEHERLNALPAHLVPDRLRAAVLDTAAAAAAHRQHAEKVAEASAAASTAARAGDLAAAELAASTLNGLALVGRYVPQAHVDSGAVAEALDGAREFVRLARGEVPAVLAVEYVLELAAWHSLGGLPANIAGGVPESLGSDLAARAQADQIRAEQTSLAASVEAWNRGQGEVLTLLGTAASFILQCRELALRTAAVNAQVRQANVDRRAAGLSWRLPDSYSSTACVRLKEFRASQALQEVSA